MLGSLAITQQRVQVPKYSVSLAKISQPKDHDKSKKELLWKVGAGFTWRLLYSSCFPFGDCNIIYHPKRNDIGVSR